MIPTVIPGDQVTREAGGGVLFFPTSVDEGAERHHM